MGPTQNSAIFPALADQTANNQIDAVEADDDDDGSTSGGLRLRGTVGVDSLIGGTGDDELDGNKGDDVLSGGAGNDDLQGGKGVDTLFGGVGADTLDGDQGNDILYGGAGADLFVVRSNRGNDVIEDFTSGEDVVRVRASTGIRDFATLSGRLSADGDGNAVIDLGRGANVTLTGVDGSVPIRLTPIPTRCRVLPLSRI